MIAVDRDPEAPGFAYADKRALVSTEDEPGIDRLARAEDVDGIVSLGADWPVGVGARVAGRLGLAHPIDAATAAPTTKVAAARALRRGRRAATPSARGAGGPPRGQGARSPGPARLTVRTEQELVAAIEAALAASRNGAYIVEEYVDGPEETAGPLGRRRLPPAARDRPEADPPAFGVALAHVWPCVSETQAPIAGGPGGRRGARHPERADVHSSASERTKPACG